MARRCVARRCACFLVLPDPARPFHSKRSSAFCGFHARNVSSFNGSAAVGRAESRAAVSAAVFQCNVFLVVAVLLCAVLLCERVVKPAYKDVIIVARFGLLDHHGTPGWAKAEPYRNTSDSQWEHELCKRLRRNGSGGKCAGVCVRSSRFL
jgi:hypothetical protein